MPSKSLCFANRAIPLLWAENDTSRYLYMLNSKSYLFQTLEEYDSMAINNLFAHNEAERLVSHDNIAYQSALNNLARVYQIQDNSEEAIALYKSALKTVDFDNRGNANLIGTLYENLGLIYKKRGDWYIALEYLDQALGYHMIHQTDQLNGAPHVKLAKVYQFIGQIYHELKEYPECEKSLIRSEQEFLKISISNSAFLSYLYKDFIKLYTSNDDFEQAQAYSDRALTLKDLKSFERATVLESLGDLYSAQNKFDKAIKSYEFSLNLISTKQIVKRSELRRKLANTSVEVQSYDEAQAFYNISEELLEVKDFLISVNRIDQDAQFFHYQEMSFLFRDMARFNYILYEKQGDPKRLKASLAQYENMTKAIYALVDSYHADESKWIFLREVKTYYSEAIRTSRLYESYNSREALSYCSFFINSSKSILYKLEMNKRVASKENTSERLILEKRIRSIMGYLSRMEEDSPNRPGYETELFQARQELIKVKDQYPFFKLPIPSTDIQMYQDSSILHLNYFLHNNEGFLIYYLDGDDPILERFNSTKANEFNKLIQQSFSHQQLWLISDSLLSELYSVLIPSVDLSRVNKIRINPDSWLSILSFDMLKDQNGEFLAQKYEINYVHTEASSLHEKLSREPNGSVFIQIPLSDIDQSTYDLEYETLGNYFDYHIRNEYVNHNQVIKHLKNDGIVHVSSHAVYDSTHYDPYIVLHDTSLYLRDILSLNINMDLLVLSACQTELGYYIPGEGLNSLSRGFSYAGAKSIVSSLWNVNELSTLTILNNFYNNLKQGQSKSKALQNAKLTYLKTAPDHKRHPYYWAGLILIGDDGPVELGGATNYLIWTIVLVLLTISLGYYYQSNKAVPEH